MDLNLSVSNHNSQSFDEVLEKLKQSMKAARSGGWIDSDSGSELEIGIDHPSLAPPPPPPHHCHPCIRHGILPRSTATAPVMTTATTTTTATHPIIPDPFLQIKDGKGLLLNGQVEEKPRSDQANLLPTPLLINTKSLNLRPTLPELTNPKTRPIKTWLNGHHQHHHHPVDPTITTPTTTTSTITTNTTHTHEPRILPFYEPPTSPYASRTPSTPVSIGTSSGSPYVRHHFKWEYLAPSSTNSEGIPQPNPQPRIVESSSPPHIVNPDESYTDWPRGFFPKELILPPELSQPPLETAQPLELLRRTPNLAGNFSYAASSNGPRAVSYSPVHSKSQSPAHQPLGPGIPGFEIRPAAMNSFKSAGHEPPHKPWLASASLPESKQNVLNPASVSSVSFSLAPAAPIRLTAPEGDPEFKTSFVPDENSRSPTLRQVNPTPDPRVLNCSKPQPGTISTSASSTSLRDLAQERDKEAIRARLMGSSSIDNFNTKLQHVNNNPNNQKNFGNTASLTDRGHSAQVASLPNLFQQMRFSNSAHPISSSQSRVHPFPEASPLRSTSANYPATPSFGAPIFYSSQPHGTASRHNPFTSSSMSSSRSSLSQITQLTPETLLTPLGFGVNGHLHTPGSTITYPPTSAVNKSSFVPVIVPAVPGIGGPVGTPLPGQVQPEEVRKNVKAQPPVVNTGNSGAMIPQPGDWMCICGFVNWRRRKVCMRCFPFADGNDSVGAVMAINAQRAALLAASAPVTKDLPNSTTIISNPSPAVFQTPEIPGFQDQNNQNKDKHATLNQIFGPPESGFNYGRPLESRGVFNTQHQRMSLNPFDKSSPLGPISPAPSVKLDRSPNGVDHKRFFESFNQLPIASEIANSPGIARQEKGSKVLRARLVAPGEQQPVEGNDWEEALPKSPRPRSFSMGAKSVWDSSDPSSPSRVLDSRETHTSTQLESNRIGKEENGISGMERKLGSQAVNGRLIPEKHQELNTISTNGTNFNRQRTTTSPSSSWQAIKALWQ